MRTTRHRYLGVVLSLLIALGVTFGVTPTASATSETCISTSFGFLCTRVVGEDTHVSRLSVSRLKGPAGICDYSAWFFVVNPGGAVIDLGTESREGCNFGRAWLGKDMDRDFPANSEACAKFYEEHWQQYVTTKCVGIG